MCLAAMLFSPESRWLALAGACFYVAIILSFLGGLWWMAAMLSGLRRADVYLVSVMPSLVAWAALLPWAVGWSWPGPSLVWLGLLVLVSPSVDRWLACQIEFPAGWMKLRMAMAAGLGLLTLAIAVA